MVIVVRSRISGREVTEQLRKVVRAADPQVPLYVEGTLSDAIAFAFLPARAATIALGAFGLLAIVLALVGIYGLAGYSVSARTREIGIRLAIGARSHQVLGSILGRTAIVLIAGACIGGATGFALSRMLMSIVYHASAQDPVVILGVAFTMILIGLGAAWLPAQRALGVDPARTLREG
jgi:ABC-type antimicrobial peptide transport system permease subunit